mgnify:FL=1
MVATLSVALSTQAVVVIDTFVTPALGHAMASIPPLPATGTPLGTGGMLGGARVLAIAAAPGASNFGQISANNLGTGTQGQLDFSTGSGWSGLATVTWDNNGAGLGAYDVSPNPIVEMDVVTVDSTGVSGYVIVRDTHGVTAPTGASSAAAGVVQFDLGPLVGAYSIDLTSLESIALALVTTGQGGDVTIDEARLVPEPHEYALLAGLGLLGLAAYRRIKAA